MYNDCDICEERFHGDDIATYLREVEIPGGVKFVCVGCSEKERTMESFGCLVLDELVTFSNPRKEAEFDDWPYGRHRCKCRFVVESKVTGSSGKRAERVARTTENKTRTGWNKPKRTTYADRFVIVDGSDGKTYLLAWSKPYQHVTIWLSDVQHTLKTIHGHATPPSIFRGV